jgi:hypothetical protein
MKGSQISCSVPRRPRHADMVRRGRVAGVEVIEVRYDAIIKSKQGLV